MTSQTHIEPAPYVGEEEREVRKTNPLGKMLSRFSTPYMWLVLLLCLLGIALPFFDSKGIIAAIFIFTLAAMLRLGYSIRETLKAQVEATQEQTRVIRANNDMLKLVALQRRPVQEDRP